MRGEYDRRGGWRNPVVDILGVALGLNEKLWPIHLADVVIVGGDADEERVCSNRLCCGLGKIADHQRVSVCARYAQAKLLENRRRGIGDLEQPQVRGDAERPFQKGDADIKEAERKYARHN